MAGYQNNYLSLAKLSSSRKLIFLYYVQGQLLCPSDLINAIMTVQTHTGNTHILFINKFMQTHSHQVHPKTFGKRILLLINMKCNKIRRDSPSVSNCLQQISLESTEQLSLSTDPHQGLHCSTKTQKHPACKEIQ